MSNYKHQKKHHGMPGLEPVLARIAKSLKKGTKHRKKAKLTTTHKGDQ